MYISYESFFFFLVVARTLAAIVCLYVCTICAACLQFLPECSTLYVLLFRTPPAHVPLCSKPKRLWKPIAVVVSPPSLNRTLGCTPPPPPGLLTLFFLRVMPSDAPGARSSESRRSRRGKRRPSCCRTLTRSRMTKMTDRPFFFLA